MNEWKNSILWQIQLVVDFSGIVQRRWRHLSADVRCDIALTIEANHIQITNAQHVDTGITQEMVWSWKFWHQICHYIYLIVYFSQTTIRNLYYFFIYFIIIIVIMEFSHYSSRPSSQWRMNPEHYQYLVIHPSTFLKLCAVPNKEIFWISETLGCPGINSTPFTKSFLNLLSSYDYQDDLGFHIPHPVNFDLQILVLAIFFSFFKCDVFIKTSISTQVLDFLSRMTTSGLLAKIYLSVIIE